MRVSWWGERAKRGERRPLPARGLCLVRGSELLDAPTEAAKVVSIRRTNCHSATVRWNVFGEKSRNEGRPTSWTVAIMLKRAWISWSLFASSSSVRTISRLITVRMADRIAITSWNSHQCHKPLSFMTGKLSNLIRQRFVSFLWGPRWCRTWMNYVVEILQCMAQFDYRRYTTQNEREIGIG